VLVTHLRSVAERVRSADMKRGFFFLPLLLPLSLACGSDRASASPSNAPNGEHPNEPSPAPGIPEAGRSYLDANDFDGDRLEIALPVAPSGETLLAVVPELTSSQWLSGENMHARALHLSLSTTALDHAPSRVPGHAVPEVTPLRAEEWKAAAPSAPPRAPATERTFDVYDPLKKSYASFSAKLSYTGERYAYYDDVANEDRLAAAEYETIDRELSARYGELARIFGEPGDVDGDGRHVVVMSKTAWLVRKDAGEAYVDGNAKGEIIMLWSRDGLGSLADRDWLTRTILHETVHLSQNARAVKKRGAVGERTVPAFYVEGMAETMRLRFGLGGADVTTPEASPFTSPYVGGGVFAWWLEKRFGDGVHQRVIDAALAASRTSDVTTIAFGVREPLVFAWFWSELAVDARVPVAEAAVGTTSEASAGYTGAVLRRVKHSTPVHVTLHADGNERATVMILRR
jgi:hypothetical protein